MAVNGSEFINNPFNTTYSPWTDLFETLVGNGQVFWLIPLVILTLGVYVKTDNPIMTTAFMVAGGSLFSAGSVWTGAIEMASIFVIFTALGITGMFVSLLLQRGK